MKNKKETINIKIQHTFYKFKGLKNFKKLKNLVMFALYLSFLVVIIKFAEGKIIKNAFGNNLSEKEQFGKRSIFENKIMQKYFTDVIGDKSIVENVLKYSEVYNIEPTLFVALMKIESSFNPEAINYNNNGSIDRGLFQLNNRTFPELKNQDFYNAETNTKNAAKFLKWCLTHSKNSLVKALAYYNAGIGNVSNKKVGEMTLDYINKIIDEKINLDEGLELYKSENLDLFLY